MSTTIYPQSPLPSTQSYLLTSSFDETSVQEVNEQTLGVKEIFYQKEAKDREFNLDWIFFSQPHETLIPRQLEELVSEGNLSGNWSEEVLVQLFGSGNNDVRLTRVEILGLDGQKLLDNLIGTAESPLSYAKWVPKRAALQSWLLDNSRPKYIIRQGIWVVIHNMRSSTWRRHFQLHCGRRTYAEVHGSVRAPTPVEADCLGTTVRTTRPKWLEVNCEIIMAIEERLGLKEAKMGTSRIIDHFEREWWILRSDVPQHYIGLFWACFIPGEKITDKSAGFFSRADEIASEQVAHWRTVENSQLFAIEVNSLATIAQLRIDYGIVEDLAGTSQTVDDTLKLLEEVELLFSTTLYEVDHGPTLESLNLKAHVGSGMGIWRIGTAAMGLLYLAIFKTKAQDQSGTFEKLSPRQQQWLEQL